MPYTYHSHIYPTLQTSHNSPCNHSVHIHGSNHTHLFQLSWLSADSCSPLPEMEVRGIRMFLSPFVQMRSPPSANQGLATAEPRHGHAVWIVHPPNPDPPSSRTYLPGTDQN